MQDTIKRIEAKNNEIKALLSILGMWGKVKDQGIDTDSVLSFGFDPALVPEDELKRLAINNPFNKNNPYNWETRDVDGTLKITPKIYNYVRLKNGEKIPLNQPVTNPLWGNN